MNGEVCMNKNRLYNKKYKELAEKAVNNLLDLVNSVQEK